MRDPAPALGRLPASCNPGHTQLESPNVKATGMDKYRGACARPGATFVAFLAIVLALRLCWVPLHLAQHAHDLDHAPATLAVSHASAGHGAGELVTGELGSGASGSDHDHGPHPAEEHRSEIVSPRVSQDPVVLDFVVGSALAGHVAERTGLVKHGPRDTAPKPTPPRLGRARAPPVT